WMAWWGGFVLFAIAGPMEDKIIAFFAALLPIPIYYILKGFFVGSKKIKNQPKYILIIVVLGIIAFVGWNKIGTSVKDKELVVECYEIVNDRSTAVRTLALAKSAIRHNVAKDLPSLNIPVCLIWGKNDTITPPEVAEEFNELLPKTDLFWVDECGHAPMMEQPHEFNKLYSSWLDKLYS
ncbi:MAG: alpha/beta hydrolase, partial [Flavobacteriales bacterium]|nr:alpha/beta hydrolase [Flavobacteriales bacterium]